MRQPISLVALMQAVFYCLHIPYLTQSFEQWQDKILGLDFHSLLRRTLFDLADSKVVCMSRRDFPGIQNTPEFLVDFFYLQKGTATVMAMQCLVL